MNLWLDPILPESRARAVEAFEAGSWGGFRLWASNEHSLDLVFFNLSALRERGILEEALVDAFVGTRTNNSRHSTANLRGVFSFADRARLLAAGDPLPGDGPFTIYRGVAGRGPRRRVRGLSWTTSQDRARWFAARFADILPDPAVFRVTAEKQDILFYSNARKEEEFIVLLPDQAKPVLVERVTVK